MARLRPDREAAGPGRAVQGRQADPVPGPSRLRRPARDRHLLPELPGPPARHPEGPGAQPVRTRVRGGRDLPLDRTRADRGTPADGGARLTGGAARRKTAGPGPHPCRARLRHEIS
ncbi:hypothetical protein SGPA1_10064 [Streptomyces misionensis JCM 4497]